MAELGFKPRPNWCSSPFLFPLHSLHRKTLDLWLKRCMTPPCAGTTSLGAACGVGLPRQCWHCLLLHRTPRCNKSRLKVPMDSPPQPLVCLPVLGKRMAAPSAEPDSSCSSATRAAASQRPTLFCESSWTHWLPHPFPTPSVSEEQ